MQHTGTTRNTGAGSGVTQVIVSIDGFYMLLLYLAELMSLLAWLRYIWLSLLLTDRIAPGLRRLSPLATVTGFFVPVASFWIQIQAMNDIARAARRGETQRRPLNPVLPAAITLSLFIALQFSRAVAGIPIDVFSDPNAAQHAMQMSSIADIAAFMLLILCDAFMLSVGRGQARALAKEKGRRSEPAPELREEKSKEGMSD
nr:DUF4328 domain-containing protein [Rhizobium halophytocola]